jgi:hypothetical protein
VTLAQFYETPLVVDIAIVFITLETLALWLVHRLTAWGLPLRDYLLTVLSGLSLMLALRCSLMPGFWQGMALFLVIAGLAHGADLRRRLRDKSKTAVRTGFAGR